LIRVSVAVLTIVVLSYLLIFSNQFHSNIIAQTNRPYNHSLDLVKILVDKAIESFQDNSTNSTISHLQAAYYELLKSANNNKINSSNIQTLVLLIGHTIKVMSENNASLVTSGNLSITDFPLSPPSIILSRFFRQPVFLLTTQVAKIIMVCLILRQRLLLLLFTGCPVGIILTGIVRRAHHATSRCTSHTPQQLFSTSMIYRNQCERCRRSHKYIWNTSSWKPFISRRCSLFTTPFCSFYTSRRSIIFS
jgi:hypothetical protein